MEYFSFSSSFRVISRKFELLFGQCTVQQIYPEWLIIVLKYLQMLLGGGRSAVDQPVRLYWATTTHTSPPLFIAHSSIPSVITVRTEYSDSLSSSPFPSPSHSENVFTQSYILGRFWVTMNTFSELQSYISKTVILICSLDFSIILQLTRL